MTGGPPVRGTKLLAWRVPPFWKTLEQNTTTAPKGSIVVSEQKRLFTQTQRVLKAIARDVQEGLLETVGVKSSLLVEDRCSIIIELPAEADTKFIARAIDLENVEAWCDESGKVNIGISPWYSTKDVDQTVLSATKVIHVLLGLHGSAATLTSQTFGQKLLTAVAEIMMVQKKARQEWK